MPTTTVGFKVTPSVAENLALGQGMSDNKYANVAFVGMHLSSSCWVLSALENQGGM